MYFCKFYLLRSNNTEYWGNKVNNKRIKNMRGSYDFKIIEININKKKLIICKKL